MATVPQTLFLRGVFLKDLVTLETLYNDQASADSSSRYYLSADEDSFISHDDYSETGSIIYDKIPKIFISLKDWPHKTNIKCKQCTLNILGPPIPIPKSIEITKDSDKIYDIEGACCSFACAATLITYSIYNKSLRWQILGMLKMIRKDFYKNGYSKISKKYIKSISLGSDLSKETFLSTISSSDPANFINHNHTYNNFYSNKDSHDSRFLREEIIEDTLSNPLRYNDSSFNYLHTMSNDIPLAPQKEELCIYGIGKLSIKEFRDKIWNIEFS